MGPSKYGNTQVNGEFLRLPITFALDYDADYSMDYTDRSLVDKEYVDSLFAGTSYWNLVSPGDLQLNIAVTGALLPAIDDITDLGSLTYRFRDLYLGSKIDAATDLDIWTSGASRVYVDTSGNVGVGTSTPSSRIEIIGSGTSNLTKNIVVKNQSNDPMFEVTDNGSFQIGHEYNDGYNNVNLLDVISPSAFSTSQRFSIGFDSQIYLNVDPSLTVSGSQHLKGLSNFYSVPGNPSIMLVDCYDDTKIFSWIWDNPGTDHILSLLNNGSSSRIITFDYATGNVGIRTGNLEAPTATLDVSGYTGYNQLRLRTSYTPTSSADTNGNTGDVAWDDDYVYVKTSAGWKRSGLTAF